MIIYLELSDTDVSNLTLLFMKTVYTERLHTMLNPIIFINKNLKLKGTFQTPTLWEYMMK